MQPPARRTTLWLIAFFVIIAPLGNGGLDADEPDRSKSITRDEEEHDPRDPILLTDSGGLRDGGWGLSFSPDGRYLAAGGVDYEVRIWDLHTGRQVHTLRAEILEFSGGVTDVSYSPKGDALVVNVYATGHATPSVRVYDPKNPSQILRVLSGHFTSPVLRCQFSPSGEYFATMEENGTFRVFEWPSMTLVREKTAEFDRADDFATWELECHDMWCRVIDDENNWFWFANDTRPFAMQKFRDFTTGTLKAITPNNEEHRQTIIRALEEVRTMTPENVDAFAEHVGTFMSNTWADKEGPFPEDGRFLKQLLSFRHQLLVGAGRGKENGRDVYWSAVWDGSGELMRVCRKHRFIPLLVALSPDASRVAVEDDLGEIIVWEVATGEILHTLKGKGEPAYALCFAEDGLQLAYGQRPHPSGRGTYNDFGPLEKTFDLTNRRILQGTPSQLYRSTSERGALSLELILRNEELHMSVRDRGREMYTLTYPFLLDPAAAWSFMRTNSFGAAVPMYLADAGEVVAVFDARTGRTLRACTTDCRTWSAAESADGRFLACGLENREVVIFSMENFNPETDGGGIFADEVTGVVQGVERGSDAEGQGIGPGDRVLSVMGKDWVDAVKEWATAEEPTIPIGATATWIIARDGESFRYELEARPTYDTVWPILYLFMTKEDEWVIVTPEGYYDASTNGDQLIGWHVNQGPENAATWYSAQQFSAEFFRPDVIDKVLEIGDTTKAIEQANAERGRPNTEPLSLSRREDLDRIAPPVVEVLEPSDGAKVSDGIITVKAKITSQNRLPIDRVSVLVNGKLTATKGIEREDAGDGQVQFVTRQVALYPGDNVIAVYADNASSQSAPEELNIRFEPSSTTPDTSSRQPNLYVLSIGIAEYQDPSISGLKFCDDDARSFADVWRQQGSKQYQKVSERVLIDADATSNSIIDGLDWLVDSATTDDLVVLFISAHGERDKRDNFFLISHDTSIDKLRSSAVDFDRIRNIMTDIQGQVIVFIDTCYSGGLTGYKSASNDLTRSLRSGEVGPIIFASSLPETQSLERDDWRHGAFTKAFLDAIADPSLSTGDGRITLGELEGGIDQRLKELTEQRQRLCFFRPPVTDRDLPLLTVEP